MIFKIKIKRHEYEITENDAFMDNGACIQLLTQSTQRGDWGRRVTPVLSKRAEKEISVFQRIEHKHNYGNGVSVFSLKETAE